MPKLAQCRTQEGKSHRLYFWSMTGTDVNANLWSHSALVQAYVVFLGLKDQDRLYFVDSFCNHKRGPRSLGKGQGHGIRHSPPPPAAGRSYAISMGIMK